MDEPAGGELRPVPSFFPPWKPWGAASDPEGRSGWTDHLERPVGLFDREGREIDALTYDDLWHDQSYRDVAHDVAYPTMMSVLTAWVGIPIPACMFSTAVYRLGEDRYVTVSETDTQEQALWVHELALDAVRLGVELRDGALMPSRLREINPGTPDTVCRCPGMDNGWGRRRDDWWVKTDLCLLHWSPMPMLRRNKDNQDDHHGGQDDAPVDPGVL